MYDVICLTEEIHDSCYEVTLLPREMGTILEIYSDPSEAYEVEFCNSDGTTKALLAITRDKIKIE